MSFGFQLRFLFPILICVFTLLALTFALVWLPLNRDIAADPSPVVKALLAAQLYRIGLWLATLFLLSGSFAAIFALLHARRVASPVSRLKEALARVAIGDPEPIAFAPRDEFRDLEAPFNGVVNRVEQLTRTKMEMLRFQRRNLEGIQQRSASGQLSPIELREAIDVMLRDIDAEIKKLQMKA